MSNNTLQTDTDADAVRWIVETGKGRGAYNNHYTFATFSRAIFHFNYLNTHSGHKKRLVRVSPDGSRRTIHRVLT